MQVNTGWTAYVLHADTIAQFHYFMLPAPVAAAEFPVMHATHSFMVHQLIPFALLYFAVRQAVEVAFPHALLCIHGVDVSSGVSNQPIGERETLKGRVQGF